MRISRLRLRLAAGFALAFAIGIAVVAAGGLAFLSWESTRRFDARLSEVGAGLLTALGKAQPAMAEAMLTGLAGGWPSTKPVRLDAQAEAVLATLPAKLSPAMTASAVVVSGNICVMTRSPTLWVGGFAPQRPKSLPDPTGTAAAVPARVAVPLPLSVKVTPVGSAPVLEIPAGGEPVVVTVKEPAVPTVKVVLLALVMAGD